MFTQTGVDNLELLRYPAADMRSEAEFCMQIFNKYQLNALNKHAAMKIMSLQSNLLLFLAGLLQVKQMLSRQDAAKTFA